MKVSRTLQSTALFLTASGLQAQPAPATGAGQPMVHQSMSGDHHANYRAEFTASFDAELNRADMPLGEFNASMFGVDYSALFRTSDRYTWGVGAGWDYGHFDVPAGVPVPETAHAVFVRLSNRWRFADKWSLRTDVRPGLYSDFEDVSGDDFNVPFTVFVAYSHSPSLTLVAGLNVNYQSDLPVIGGPGILWRFAERWQLAAVLPRPQITYSPSDPWTLFAGGELKSMTVRVAEDFGSRYGEAILNNDTLSYRELRVGGGARYRFNRLFEVTVEGGYAIDRRFEFDDARLLLNGDGAPYVMIAINGSY